MYLILVHFRSGIIAEEKGALVALINLVKTAGESNDLLIVETLNLTTFDRFWEDDFSNYKEVFISSIRRIIDVTRANYRFRLFCGQGNGTIRKSCNNLTVSFTKIFKFALRLRSCWHKGPQRRRLRSGVNTQHFLKVLSQSFGQMLFSQGYLVFKFEIDDTQAWPASAIAFALNKNRTYYFTICCIWSLGNLNKPEFLAQERSLNVRTPFISLYTYYVNNEKLDRQMARWYCLEGLDIWNSDITVPTSYPPPSCHVPKILPPYRAFIPGTHTVYYI